MYHQPCFGLQHAGPGNSQIVTDVIDSDEEEGCIRNEEYTGERNSSTVLRGATHNLNRSSMSVDSLVSGVPFDPPDRRPWRNSSRMQQPTAENSFQSISSQPRMNYGPSYTSQIQPNPPPISHNRDVYHIPARPSFTQNQTPSSFFRGFPPSPDSVPFPPSEIDSQSIHSPYPNTDQYSQQLSPARFSPFSQSSPQESHQQRLEGHFSPVLRNSSPCQSLNPSPYSAPSPNQEPHHCHPQFGIPPSYSRITNPTSPYEHPCPRMDQPSNTLGSVSRQSPNSSHRGPHQSSPTSFPIQQQQSFSIPIQHQPSHSNQHQPSHGTQHQPSHGSQHQRSSGPYGISHQSTNHPYQPSDPSQHSHSSHHCIPPPPPIPHSNSAPTFFSHKSLPSIPPPPPGFPPSEPQTNRSWQFQ
ncbi:uncharacterized protein LOC129617111 [Condylostylus longicornis]|uniref:uncharacterized protein LOC129617111 n=1 Tax=Condylostylus longicornis TaxID=2530218 RepID=UPI00244DFCF0|nr:uncharacterized protein LOC129617111 [Condylostylus longicornis]